MRGGPREACRVDPAKIRKQPGVTLPRGLQTEIKAVAKALGIPASHVYEQALREWLDRQKQDTSATGDQNAIDSNRP